MDRLIRIRWSNHQGSLLSSFDTLLAKELMDVTLACEGQLLRAHKLVLCACSTYFEEILSVDPSKHPIIFMRDTQYSELKALIQYMYRGEVEIEKGKLESLISLAQALKIRGLAQLESNFSTSAKPAASPVPEAETDNEPITTEPETINQDEEQMEENPIISSGVAAAAATVDLLPTAPTNKSSTAKSVTATASSPDRKRKASHSPPRVKRNPLTTEPGLHNHILNRGIRNPPPTGHGLHYHLVRDLGPGFVSKDGFEDEENGDEVQMGGYLDSISDFQDEEEEGQDSTIHSHLSTAEGDSDNENEDEQGIALAAVNSDEERMPHSPTVGLDVLKKSVDLDGLGFLREMTIEGEKKKKGRKNLKPEFQCPNPGCGRYYSQKSSLKRHLEFECNKEPKFSCPHCGRKSKLRGNAEKHEAKCKNRTQGPAASRTGR